MRFGAQRRFVNVLQTVLIMTSVAAVSELAATRSPFRV